MPDLQDGESTEIQGSVPNLTSSKNTGGVSRWRWIGFHAAGAGVKAAVFLRM